MSGTSADGIDVALVRVTNGPDAASVQSRNCKISPVFRFPATSAPPYFASPRAQAPPPAKSASSISVSANFLPRSCARACRRFRVNPRRISLIGSHGQTIYHQGIPGRFLGARVASTLQIGEPAVIAKRRPASPPSAISAPPTWPPEDRGHR